MPPNHVSISRHGLLTKHSNIQPSTRTSNKRRKTSSSRPHRSRRTSKSDYTFCRAWSESHDTFGRRLQLHNSRGGIVRARSFRDGCRRRQGGHSGVDSDWIARVARWACIGIASPNRNGPRMNSAERKLLVRPSGLKICFIYAQRRVVDSTGAFPERSRNVRCPRRCRTCFQGYNHSHRVSVERLDLSWGSGIDGFEEGFPFGLCGRGGNVVVEVLFGFIGLGEIGDEGVGYRRWDFAEPIWDSGCAGELG